VTSQAPVRRPWHAAEAQVRVLAPDQAGSLAAFMDAAGDHLREPFDTSRVETVARLSSGILRDATLRHDPASVAAAYWMRKATVTRLKERYDARCAADLGIVRVPVGRVFHVAPSNVDTLFVYSWVLSYLCGNANMVRLSQQQTPVVAALLRVFSELAREDADLREANRFVTYEHDATVTGALSAWCSHRIIWGGDSTVDALRPLTLSPHASERLFGSKFSYAVIGVDRYLSASDDEQARLAAGFFNDLFWFDQMACSSPQIVFWVGEPGALALAQTVFDRRLQDEVQRRAYEPLASNAVRRLVYAFSMAVETPVEVHLEHPGFVAVRVEQANALGKDTCGGGLIRHARLDRLEQLEPFVTEVDQTVTHYGLEAEALTALAVRIGKRGVDRIVPIGQALAFDVVWDGHDLLEDLVRKVTVRVSHSDARVP
jgi:hypothetical protein